MIEISTYCQTTPWNDRLLSLLSAVLLNPIRPNFTRAINDKPTVLPAHRQTQNVVGVVIVLPLVGESNSSVWRACKRLRRRIQRFAIRYSLHVTFVNSHQAKKENFVQTLNDIVKVTDSYFLVSFDGNATVFKDISRSEGDQGLRLLGLVLLQPGVEQNDGLGIVISNYSHVPMLLLSPEANGQLIKSANNSSPLLLLALLSDDHCLGHWVDDEMMGVWLGRTIAKFIEAITLMTANEEKNEILSRHRSKL
ncbi:unnamed protein product [Cylindrotheca closterium]|uniref:Uncharacterized protein n=1 Tax=Cylindrotheca closterium TaxID=2856 RepID=A0AAD2FP13_9STRA|nr:unnamed protein product [Cylindrotheca closterium]